MEMSILPMWSFLMMFGLFGGGGEASKLDEADLARGAAQVIVLGLRSQAAVEYDEIVYDRRSGTVSIEGLDIDSPEGSAEIGAVRISSPDRPDSIALRYEIDDLHMQLSSLDLPTATKLQISLLGFDELTASSAFEISYDMAKSDARVTLTQDVDQIGRLAMTLDFVDLRLITPDGAPEDILGELPEPQLGGALAAATLSFEDDGALESGLELTGMERPTPEQALALAQQMAVQLSAILAGRETDPSYDAASAPPPIRDIATQVQTELAAFLTEGDRLSVTIDPIEPVSFQELMALTEEASPNLTRRAALLARMRPVVSAEPAPQAPMIANTAASTGGAPETVLATAQALATGVGAPQNPARAIELLRPLADAGEADATLLLARSLAARGGEGDLADAYGYAIRAQSLDADGASALASELATRLGAKEQLDAEDAALAAAPPSDDLLALTGEAQQGDAVSMRRLAEAYAGGDGAPRNLKQAYYWALIATAAGERSALGLRDRLAGAFARAEEEDVAFWAGERQRLADQALEAWNAGIGAAAQ